MAIFDAIMLRSMRSSAGKAAQKIVSRGLRAEKKKHTDVDLESRLTAGEFFDLTKSRLTFMGDLRRRRRNKKPLFSLRQLVPFLGR